MSLVFDPELSAHLHNQILERAWIGAGRDADSIPPKSWWEESSPIPFDLASRINSKLIRFLRSAKAIIFDPDSRFNLFYYFTGLHGKDDLFASISPLRCSGDRYVWLYPSTRIQSDEEVGILFDQETELAAFVPHWEEIIPCDRRRWPWRPLQNILQFYLDLVDEGKITTYSDPQKRSEDYSFESFPWEIHQYTVLDVERAIVAFTRLLDAIEIRIPSNSIYSTYNGDHKQSSLEDGDHKLSSLEGIALPYSESVMNASFIEADWFIKSFLAALPIRYVKFRHIAPGIRIQTPIEFMNQPLADRRYNVLIPDLYSTNQEKSSFPLLLFRGERENKSSWTRPWFPDEHTEDTSIPSGLYIEPTDKDYNWKSDNQSRLLLPFSVGANGFARSSNGIPFKNAMFARAGRPDQLYSGNLCSGYSGYLPWDFRSTYLHNVLESWAERVEMGDWEVDEDGVIGGIDKFKEADTEAHWREYFIPW